MTPEQLSEIKEALKKTVDEKVNGKIDRLVEKIDSHNEKHEQDMVEVREHIKEVAPILETYKGASALGNLVKWLGSIVLVVAAVWALFLKQ